MVFKMMNIGELTIEQTRTYYPMLTEQRKNKINAMESADERAVTFCSEILARKCLSELLDAPEFSFQLLCNANSKSIVGNYTANLNISSAGRIVVCAAGITNVGTGVREYAPFSFSEAQTMFTDAEIRAIYSESRSSFVDLIKMPACNEESVMRMHALFAALKDAYFNASGRGVRTNLNKVGFLFNGDRIVCTDENYIVGNALFDDKTKTAVAVIERIA